METMTVPQMFAIEHSYYSILLSLQIIAERPSLLLGWNYLVILRQHDTEKKHTNKQKKEFGEKSGLENISSRMPVCLSISPRQPTV